MLFNIETTCLISTLKVAKFPMHIVRDAQQSTDLTSSGQILNCQFLAHLIWVAENTEIQAVICFI